MTAPAPPPDHYCISSSGERSHVAPQQVRDGATSHAGPAKVAVHCQNKYLGRKKEVARSSEDTHDCVLVIRAGTIPNRTCGFTCRRIGLGSIKRRGTRLFANITPLRRTGLTPTRQRYGSWRLLVRLDGIQKREGVRFEAWLL